MSEENEKLTLRDLVPFIAVGSVIVLMFGFMIQQTWFPVPDFKEGDCIARVYEAEEFKPRYVSRSIEKIVKIGNYNYLTMGYWLNRDGKVEPDYDDFNTVTIQFEDDYVQVSCETGLEL